MTIYLNRVNYQFEPQKNDFIPVCVSFILENGKPKFFITSLLKAVLDSSLGQMIPFSNHTAIHVHVISKTPTILAK